MTSAERVQLFRPEATLTRLAQIEAAFLGSAQKASSWQAELIRLQLVEGIVPDSFILGTKPIKNLLDALVRLLAQAYAYGAVVARSELRLAEAIRRGLRFQAEPFVPEVGVNWYRRYSLRIVGEEQAAVLQRAKDTIIRSIEQGLTDREVVRELESVFTAFGRDRLERIARTETAKIYEQARWQEFDSSDDIVGYEIMGIHDARICEICAYRDGKRIPKNAISGWLPPAHVACRCILAPIFAWEEGIEYTDPAAGPKPQPGFGTTSMEILDWRTKGARRVATQIGMAA